ncbi:MAG: PRC-barrel domain containing protein [Ignavibacteria bacterium]|nr:PRC-barrel domain containing protein [Ignavibacteria bacterium]MCU7503681.1 PRC-barrel domain containing protein [Ignavibacteria bacterium]MCU7517672.1 PRC-barrel domain containing protein [Ignavibacteria bacterium]
MLRSVKTLEGYKIHALDGEIGEVNDFFFDDVSWNIRYLVVDTGTWLQKRLVLISPHSLGKPDWKAKRFPVNLTKEKIQNSPSVEMDRPVSRQQETDLSDYYGWPYYWTGLGAGFPGAIPPVPPASLNYPDQGFLKGGEKREREGDPHLRSARDVIDYKIQAEDNKIGNVEDFILEDDLWSIRYMVVDTGKWLLPGKKVLIALPWIQAIDWDQSSVFVNLTASEVEQSPEYHPDRIINKEFETELFNYYKRPVPWK